ncbi:MAG: hypothetical protein M1820_005843 [Bogoriella megaspora]|nr:MAG: hypothetical protein M1820_005843 [Bogoriella megaspora]
MAWIRQFAKPRMNYMRSLKDQETPSHALELLAKYERIAPFLKPPATESKPANVLWHPDLHLDNMFVNPTSYEITAIVDWQSAITAPLFYQSGVHPAFRHYKSVHEGWVIPGKPSNFEELPLDEQKRVDRDIKSEMIHKYFELQTMERVPCHWKYLQQPVVPLLRNPVWLVTGVWEKDDLFFLRDSLITLFTRWKDIYGEDTECPINFSAEELEQHIKEEENVDGVGKMLSLLQDQGILPADGRVKPEDYQTAVENNQEYKQRFLNAAENQYERDLYSKIWPFQERVR